jgi:hypothetical protein
LLIHTIVTLFFWLYIKSFWKQNIGRIM